MSLVSKKEVSKKVGSKAKKLKESIQRMTNLFAIIIVVVSLLVSAGFHYEILKTENQSLIIEHVSAAAPGEFPQSADNIPRDRDDWEYDCNSAIAKHSDKYSAHRQLGERIVLKESTNRSSAENPNSTAAGCFQFVIGTWRHYGKELWGDDFYKKNIYNPIDNTELGLYIISKYGTGDWKESGF